MKFTWNVDGRSVSSNQLGKAITESMQKQIQAAAEQQIKAKLAAIRCPVHHQPPRNLRVEGNVLKNAQVKMDCCCDPLKAAIQAAMK